MRTVDAAKEFRKTVLFEHCCGFENRPGSHRICLNVFGRRLHCGGSFLSGMPGDHPLNRAIVAAIATREVSWEKAGLLIVRNALHLDFLAVRFFLDPLDHFGLALAVNAPPGKRHRFKPFG